MVISASVIPKHENLVFYYAVIFLSYNNFGSVADSGGVEYPPNISDFNSMDWQDVKIKDWKFLGNPNSIFGQNISEYP